MVNIDPLAVEAARVAIVNATETTESAYGRWVEAGKLVKAAWITEGLADTNLIKEWIVAGLPASDQATLALDADKVTDKKARKAAQDKVSQYFGRVMKTAYPPAVVVQPAPELTPEQAEAKAAQVAATQAAIEKGEAVKAAADAETAKKIAEAEAKLAETKANACAAAAKLDNTKAAEAEALKAQAEAAKAEAAKVKAEAEQAKAAVEQAKAAMLAAQADATAKADAIQAAKMVETIVNDINTLLDRVKGYALKVKGADDLEAGLIGLRTDFKIDNGI
jgi:colicin import membrane protein